jgi:hypothetical protein
MKEYSTPDLSIAAFLLMKGVKLIKADQKCQNLTLEFLNSGFAEYDSNVRNLKRMIYRN